MSTPDATASAADLVPLGERLRWLWQGCVLALEIWDDERARARAAGAMIFAEPEEHDYGADYWSDRSYGAVDPEGHHWWFTQRLRDRPQ